MRQRNFNGLDILHRQQIITSNLSSNQYP